MIFNPYYNKIFIKNYIKRQFVKKKDNIFLFILSPPFCGSTLLTEIILTSSLVSINHSRGTCEGQTLPLLKDIMFDPDTRWDPKVDFNWTYIKKQWIKYWDTTLPILLEKSPPNLLRANSINKIFFPSYFIILYRNPYAHCEGLIRRVNYNPYKAASFAVMCLRYQKKNITMLKNVFKLSYEELTEQPNQTINRLKNYLPYLYNININKEFNAHNYKNQKSLINLNKEKIEKLTTQQLNNINSVFKKNEDILSYFEYELIK